MNGAEIAVLRSELEEISEKLGKITLITNPGRDFQVVVKSLIALLEERRSEEMKTIRKLL